MATIEQMAKLFTEMMEAHPVRVHCHMDETASGIGAVLRFLYLKDAPVTAGQISEQLGISTARVAVLLKKMSAKNLISKTSDPVDGRVTIVQLTDCGRETIQRIWEDMCTQMEKVLDAIGEKRLMEYIETGKEIQRIVQPPEHPPV